MRTFSPHRCLLIAALCAGSSCGDATMEAPDAGRPSSDGSADLSALDAGVASPTPLPIGSEAVHPLNPGATGFDVYSESVGDRVVFEHFDDAFENGELLAVLLSEGRPTAAPATVPLEGADALVGSHSLVTHGGATWLYVFTAPSASVHGRLMRAPWSDGAAGVLEEVALPEPLRMLSWPRIVALDDGRLAMAYRDDASVVKIAYGDGARFDDPEPLGPPGAQPELAQLPGGRLVFTYQFGEGAAIASFVRWSDDLGASWTEPTPVTEARNVHDSDVFVREDGRAELYYITPTTALGFDLFRRCLTEPGELGPEELVVEPSWGNLAKPRAHRLDDGSVRLTFVDQNTGHRLHGTRLRGDAACP